MATTCSCLHTTHCGVSLASSTSATAPPPPPCFSLASVCISLSPILHTLLLHFDLLHCPGLHLPANIYLYLHCRLHIHQCSWKLASQMDERQSAESSVLEDRGKSKGSQRYHFLESTTVALNPQWDSKSWLKSHSSLRCHKTFIRVAILVMMLALFKISTYIGMDKNEHKNSNSLLEDNFMFDF